MSLEDSGRDVDEDLNEIGYENEGECNSEHVTVREEQLESSTTISNTSTASVNTIPGYGYTITSDNVDKNFRASFQRMDKGTKSVHYLHSFAAQDRIDISKYSDKPQAATVSPESVLPNVTDLSEILKDFEILISRYTFNQVLLIKLYFILQLYRIIVQQMAQYKHQNDIVVWHISSEFSTEMSKKSKVVCYTIV